MLRYAVPVNVVAFDCRVIDLREQYASTEFVWQIKTRSDLDEYQRLPKVYPNNENEMYGGIWNPEPRARASR